MGFGLIGCSGVSVLIFVDLVRKYVMDNLVDKVVNLIRFILSVKVNRFVDEF